MFQQALQHCLGIINLDNDRIALLYDRKCTGEDCNWITDELGKAICERATASLRRCECHLNRQHTYPI
jgi:hypothetical protein